MRFIPLILLGACASADATLSLGGVEVTAKGCESGVHSGVPDAVALLFDEDAGVVNDAIIVQDSGDTATVQVYVEGEGLPGLGVTSYSLVSTRECGVADFEERGYTSGGQHPVDGSFTLSCEVEVRGETVTLEGSGEVSACR